MDRNKKYFLDFLDGKGVKKVIFEPFISRKHTETLIWRRGNNLWDSPENYIETLIYLSERTVSDIIFADMRIFNKAEEKERLIKHIELKSKEILPLGFGLICGNTYEVELAEMCGNIDVLALYENCTSDKFPVIRMDGDIQSAVKRGESGWFAPDSAEYYLDNYSDKIKILGGLGKSWVEENSPALIYERIEKISANYPEKWSCGSGGMISDENYLELISLLGAFLRTRD